MVSTDTDELDATKENCRQKLEEMIPLNTEDQANFIIEVLHYYDADTYAWIKVQTLGNAAANKKLRNC